MNEEDLALRSARRTAFLFVLCIVLALIGVGCFTIGTVEVNRHQAALQSSTDSTAHTAALKSARAVTRTNALSKEQELIREQAIKNCQTLHDYVSSAIGTRRESEANSNRYALIDGQLADEFARFPNRARVASIYRARVLLDRERAHIARRGENELLPALEQSCTLPLQIGS